ncbi:M24 family metallopeptidase [Desulforegula conservatrix]|uniref:M24 family metallopeptidase n=1 Tax=Desulforegula conservatrix TaxID=153026 RepID=UPI0003FBBA74|nr:aminopeptidase P family protein [Desulforegula conservatrix]
MFFTSKTYERRIEKLRSQMAEMELDALLVSIEENRRYLSGFKGEDTQFDESAGILLVCKDALFLLTDSRFEEQARNEASSFETRIYHSGMPKTLAEIIKEKKLVRIGFESLRMSVKQFNDLKSATDELNVILSPCENMVENLRIIKDDEEISLMRDALHISESVFKALLPQIIPGVTEKQMAWELEKNLRHAGAEAMSFPVIAASGPNASLPHAIPSDRKLNTNEGFLFDWGIKLHGYCSDITRTIFIGNPPDEFKKVFITVFEAQQKAQSAIKAGVNGKDIDRIARDHIESSDYKGRFGHSLGHGVGLAIHESPRLSPIKDFILETGMVVTVEPGIYIPGWGGVRLENMVVVKPDGFEILNSTSSLDFAHWL